PTLSVVKLTSKVNKKPNQPTHYTLENARGIPYPSQVLAEQPDTINKSDIICYMAHLSDKHMEAISWCLEVELGLDTNHELPSSQCVRNFTHQTDESDSV
ncbi:MAG: type II toxin-antitoxin system PemK/MazF family toxin, partial [Clostridiales bacterium]|nr:type II toxin-antitoxin system PemK/MazF family toxin [Clostridiales bacterium]